MRFLLLSLLLLSAAAFGGTKVTPNVGSNMSILNSNNTGYLSGTNYWKQGDTVTSYMERLGRHTPIGVTPSRGVPTSRIASAAKELIRFSPTSVAASLGLMAIVEAAGWAIDEVTGQLTVPSLDYAPVDSGSYYWVPSNATGLKFSNVQMACDNVGQRFNSNGTWLFVSSSYTLNSSQVSAHCAGNFIVKSNGTAVSDYGIGRVDRLGTQCVSPYVYDASLASCVVFAPVPVQLSDIDGLHIDGDSSFYDGLMRDACNLSASPARCFDDLVEQRMLEGPATVEGPKTTSTSTQTNADGSTTTVQKETQTDFDIAYGDDHFIYTPRTTTETKVDGQTTETTTEQETADPDSEQKPEEEAVSEIAGMQCEAAVSCSGDAIQCAIAKTQKDTKCILHDAFDYPSQKTDVETAFQGEAFEMETEEIDIPSFIGQGARFLPSTCPAPIPLALSGKTLQLETQPFCTFANDLSYLIVAFATLAAALYIGRAFGGE